MLHEGSPSAHLPMALCPRNLLPLPTPPRTPAPRPANKQQPGAGGALGSWQWGPQSPFYLHTATQDLPWQPGQVDMWARREGEGREGKGPQKALSSCRRTHGSLSPAHGPVLSLPVCAGCSAGRPCVCVSASQGLHA